MGFGQGLSGLNSSAQELDVIGNNIANSGTVGFKAGTVAFADVYASSRVGLGSQVAAVNQRFTSGNIETTNNQYDMAIDGEAGFFRLVTESGEPMYSRNGQFLKNKDHYITNNQGQYLTGYPVVDGKVAVGADPVRLQVPVGNIAPQPTSGIIGPINLDSRVDAPTATPFDPQNPNTFSTTSVSTVYDSLGNPHVLTQYYVKGNAVTLNTGGTGAPANLPATEWNVYYTLDGEAMLPTTAPGTPPVWADAQTLAFSDGGLLVATYPSGSPVTVNYTNGVPDAPAAVQTSFVFTATTLAVAELEIDIDYTASATSHGIPYNFKGNPNGYGGGEFASVSVDRDGTLIANYTNGHTQPIGGLALANFNNVQGLQPVGGNAWRESPTSGAAMLGKPGTNGLALIKGKSVESSNVDMSQELVKMIIAQRTYQANAQTIKTQDQILQTLVTMR